MYCSSCGGAVTSGLTYCNHCGVRLPRGDRDRPAEVRPEGLITMMVATFVMGTFAITALMAVMKVIAQLPFGPIMVITFLCFLVMFVLEAVFIRLLFKRHRSADDSDSKLSSRRATKELEAQSRMPVEPVGSVTDRTTRTFTPVYDERK